MKKYLITLLHYGKLNAFGEPEYLQTKAEVESDTAVHAEWKASDQTGVRQYYCAWAEEISG